MSALGAPGLGGSFNLKEELSVASIMSLDFEALVGAVVQKRTALQILNREASYPVFVDCITACSR